MDEEQSDGTVAMVLDNLLAPGRPMLRGVALGLAVLVLLVLGTVTLQSGRSEARNEAPVENVAR